MQVCDVLMFLYLRHFKWGIPLNFYPVNNNNNIRRQVMLL